MLKDSQSTTQAKSDDDADAEAAAGQLKNLELACANHQWPPNFDIYDRLARMYTPQTSDSKYEESVAYIEKHRLAHLFQAFTRIACLERPANLKRYFIGFLEHVRDEHATGYEEEQNAAADEAKKSDKKSPVQFVSSNDAVLAAFQILDPARTGRVPRIRVVEYLRCIDLLDIAHVPDEAELGNRGINFEQFSKIVQTAAKNDAERLKKAAATRSA